MTFDTFILFFITTIIVVFSPGASALLTAGQGASQGLKASHWGALGIAIANVVYFLLSATGIAALVLASHQLFTLIKWAGVLYLVYLGLMAIFSASGGIRIQGSQTDFSAKQCFRKGFVIEISNPKALMYFSALVPQFIDLEAALLPQLFVMGCVCFVLDIFAYNCYGLLGYTMAKRAIKGSVVKTINVIAGGFLLYVASKMALLERQS